MSSPIRPDFAPLTNDEIDASRRFELLPWLRLMRLPNVFTAVADVAMGYLFVHKSVRSPSQLACLIAASALLYTAGMVLNDVFDIEVDRKERPFRPLPSRKVGLGAARLFGFVLLALGLAAGWLAGFLPGASAALPWRSGVMATLLALSVTAYDGFIKFTPVGPLGMGTCRFLNVLMGMSTATYTAHAVLFGYGPAELLAAGGIGLYIVGVTWFARNEAETSRSWPLVAAMTVMATGAIALGASAAYLPAVAMDRTMYWILLLLLMLTVLRRCGIAAVDPAPVNVQAGVKHSILSLIWLDAAATAATSGPWHGLAVAALLLPALILGRWVYST